MLGDDRESFLLGGHSELGIRQMADLTSGKMRGGGSLGLGRWEGLSGQVTLEGGEGARSVQSLGAAGEEGAAAEARSGRKSPGGCS